MHMTIMDKIQGHAPAAAPACGNNNDIIPRDGNTSFKGEQEWQEKARSKENKKSHNIKNRSVKKANNNVRRSIGIPIKLPANSAQTIKVVAVTMCVMLFVMYGIKIYADNQSHMKIRMKEIESEEKIDIARINLKELQENKQFDDIQSEKERNHQIKNKIIAHLQTQYIMESQNAVQYKQVCDNARTDWKILFAIIFSSEYQEQLRQHRKSACDEYIIQKNKVENIQTQILAFANTTIC